MPVIKIIPSKTSVHDIWTYVTQESKTSKDYIITSGCGMENPEQDFNTLNSAYENPEHM